MGFGLTLGRLATGWAPLSSDALQSTVRTALGCGMPCQDSRLRLFPQRGRFGRIVPRGTLWVEHSGIGSQTPFRVESRSCAGRLHAWLGKRFQVGGAASCRANRRVHRAEQGTELCDGFHPRVPHGMVPRGTMVFSRGRDLRGEDPSGPSGAIGMRVDRGRTINVIKM